MSFDEQVNEMFVAIDAGFFGEARQSRESKSFVSVGGYIGTIAVT